MPPPLPEELRLELGLDEPDDDASLRARVARELGIPQNDLPDLELRKRSLDARRGRVRFHVLLGLGSSPAVLPELPREVGEHHDVVIVGDGPAGLFCAYQLARRGIGSVVLDRGKLVQPRRRDIALLNRRGVVDPDSNYCFGEGGAGTYSDGKLYTRSHKRGNVRDVIEILVLHGAPESILVEARPHIGSSRLPKVVTALRERLQQLGVAFRFGARLVDLLVERGSVAGVRLGDGSELRARAVVLATGHSARDVFDLCLRAGLRLEPKPFALGVRIEHPQELINRIQYGAASGHPRLPAACYRLATEVEGRGVFSFCMCPGGWIVPAATEPEGLVVNGMSLRRRDSPFASSGLVVAVETADLLAAGLSGPLGGVELQRRIERAALSAGGGAQRAPATRATDFVASRASRDLPDSSYVPGLRAADVGEVLDAGGVDFSSRLRRALVCFGRRMPGFAGESAVLVAAESRTSSPVKIPRDPSSLESPDLQGLYPAGEGAGHAGGIVSAAVDGMRIARAIELKLGRARSR